MAISDREVQKSLQNILGGNKGLDPIDQTIFATGPRSAFTPPEVPNVYQEGQTIFAQQPIGVESADIDWYTLGENASKIALNTYENVLDYLITSKKNGVAELASKYESQLDEFYKQESTKMYSTDKNQKGNNAQFVESISDRIERTRKEFKDEAIKVLGSEEYFAENLDIQNMGLAYQDLAVTSRRQLRNIDQIANRLLYESQKISNGLAKKDNNWAAWKNGIGPRDPKLQPLTMMGALPVPVDENNYPLIGFTKNPDGSYVPMSIKDSFGQDRFAVEQAADGNWYVNFENLDALADNQQFDLLVDMDNIGNGPASAVFSSTGEFTADFEAMVKSTAEAEVVNPGQAAYVAVALAKLPDHLVDNALGRVSGLSPDLQLKLSMMRLHAKNGFDVKQLGQITGLKREPLKKTFERIQQLRTNTTIFNASQNPQDQEKYEELIGVTYALLKKFGTTIDEDELSLTPKAGNLIDETPAISAASLLSENPSLVPIIARVAATVESNPGLYGDDPEARQKAIELLLDEQVRREGYIVTNNPNTGMPLILYAPNMAYMENLKASLDSSPVVSGLPEVKREELKDPANKDKALIKAHLFGNNWLNTGVAVGKDFRSTAINFARQMNPQVDVEVFEALLDGGVKTTTDKNGARIQTSISGIDLLRYVIAASPTAMEKKTANDKDRVVFVDGAIPSFDSRLNAAKKVYEDLPIVSDTGAIPWFDADFNYSQTLYNFMGTPRGGRPIKITKMKGVSGVDYMDVITTKGSRQLGSITPMTTNGTPLLYIPQETDPSGGNRISLEKGMDKYLEAERGIYGYSFIPFDSESAPNAGPMPADQVIYSTNEPYLPSKIAVLANVNSSLTTFEEAKAFFAQNNTAVHDIVMSDPQLKKSKRLAWEIARDAEGVETYDKNKALFTDTNLKQLFDKAVANGAKTNVEFLGYIFNAMRVYQTNSQRDFGRNIGAEKATQSSSVDFVVPKGESKGLVLYSPQSEKFITGVETGLASGFNLYSKDNQYYMLRAKEAGKDYRLVIDAATAAESTTLQTIKDKQARAKKARETFFAERTPALSVTAIESLARPTTISQDKIASFQKDFMKYVHDKDLTKNPDFRYIDWTKLYADKGSFPASVEEVHPSYFLPGHSSTLPLRAKIAMQGREEGFVGQGIEETVKERMATGQNVLPELSAATAVYGTVEGFFRGIYSSFMDTNKNDIQVFRENNVDADPQDWLNSVLGTDELALIRRSSGGTVWNIPEEQFNVVHYIKNSNNPYSPESSFGLTEASWKIIQESPLSKPALEYQLRVLASRMPNNTQTVRSASGSVEFNKPTVEEAAKTMNEVISQLAPNNFVLDEGREKKLREEIAIAYQQVGKQAPKAEDIDRIIKDPSRISYVKQRYFEMTLYPDGYMSKTRKTTKQSRIEALIEMLML